MDGEIESFNTHNVLDYLLITLLCLTYIFIVNYIFDVELATHTHIQYILVYASKRIFQ